MTNATEFRLLVIADLHYATSAQPAPPGRKIALGKELLQRAIDDAAFRGGFDAIVLTGDLVNDGLAPCSDSDLAELKAVLEKAAPGRPVLCVPGNHDGPKQRLFSLFGDPGCTRELRGYRFVLFAEHACPAKPWRSRVAESEYYVITEGQGRTVHEWKAKPSKPDNPCPA